MVINGTFGSLRQGEVLIVIVTKEMKKLKTIDKERGR